MKKIYFAVVLLLIFVIISVSIFIQWFKKESGPVTNSSSSGTVRFVVNKGKSASEVGELLFRKKLIRNKLVFKLYVQFLDKTKNINAGEFELSPSMSLSEIVNVLGKGPKELWVTIPEGLRREEIVEKIIRGLEVEEGNQESFRTEFLNITKLSEGYLFPDTYLFPRDASAKIVSDRLVSTFNQKYENTIAPILKDNRFTKNEVVIMASILERETKTLAERPIVSGILWKRIENDWPLQVDASVQYAIATSKFSSWSVDSVDNWWPILSLDDLNIESPYNTYKNQGLPPSPISNPGIASLQAAAQPEVSEYWFYIHSPDGIIHYATTSDEHAQTVRKYLGKN